MPSSSNLKTQLLALGDQAILSAGNFLTNIAIYRKFSAAASGDYYIVLTFILFLNNLHMALVTYPLSITAGTHDDREFRRRVKRSVQFTLVGSVVCGLAISPFVAHIGGLGLLPWMLAALILWQLQETLRRAMMARLDFKSAIPGDIISYLCQAAFTWALIGPATPVSWAFAIIAGTSLAAIAVQLVQLRAFDPVEISAADPTPRQQLQEHWAVGKWVLLANLANALTVYAPSWVIGGFRGMAAAAMFGAVLQLLNASNPVLTSVAGLITPAVAKIRKEHSLAMARKMALRFALQGLVLLLPFFVVILLVPHFVLARFYRPDSPYVVLVTPLRVYVLVYLVMYVVATLAAYLCGLGKSQWPFVGQAANAVITCVLTLPLAAWHGVYGAAWGALAAISVQLLINAYYVRRARSLEDEPRQPVTPLEQEVFDAEEADPTIATAPA